MLTQVRETSGRTGYALFDSEQTLEEANPDFFGGDLPLADKAGFQSTTADGRLIGPFNPCLLSPAISAQFLQLQFTEQQHTSLSERVRQVVILTVGAVWRADYELYAHSAAARRTGLADAAIATLVNGGVPDELTKEEKIAHRVAEQLSTSHRVGDGVYRDAEEAFGAAGLMEIATLVGIHHTVCAVLNVFDVPAPELQGAAVTPLAAADAALAAV